MIFGDLNVERLSDVLVFSIWFHSVSKSILADIRICPSLLLVLKPGNICKQDIDATLRHTVSKRFRFLHMLSVGVGLAQRPVTYTAYTQTCMTYCMLCSLGAANAYTMKPGLST